MKKQMRLLIIDPNTDKNTQLTNVLQEIGITNTSVLCHPDHAEALAIQEPFDLIILGDVFVEKNVTQAIKILKKSPHTNQIPIILHTISKKAAATRQLVALGIESVLLAPCDQNSLSRAIKESLKVAKSKEYSQLVRNAHFFEEFSNQEIKEFAKVAIPRRFEAGESIISKGDPADRFYILLKGSVEIVVPKKDGHPYRCPVAQGDSFGELAILDHTERTAWCIASDDCLVLEIGEHIIRDQSFTLRHKVLSKLAFVLAARLRNTNDAIKQALLPDEEVTTNMNESELVEEEFSDNEEIEEFDDTIEMENTDSSTGDQNPYLQPTGKALEISDEVQSQEEYDILTRKVLLRTDFVAAKVPNTLGDVFRNKLFGYLTGGKLAKMNPHKLWNPKWFTPGTPRTKRALHLVVLASQGDEYYNEAYLGLPFTQKVIAMSDTGCTGTFLGSDQAIDRYFKKECLKKAIQLDLEMPIDRVWRRKECIEFLTHTAADVRPDTLFLIFDRFDGRNTQIAREAFPDHQMITVLLDLNGDPENPSSFFVQPEEKLQEARMLCKKADYVGDGFYSGQSYFIAGLGACFEETAFQQSGPLFGMIGTLAQMGPDYSGVTWGSKGGAEGAVKAARALYGMAGAQSSKDLANAINWADGT
ncbi:MAG: hypothetical protein CMO81_07565 [Waddliaceae bacterium]|nr:hypothetical protein [Waddliaceae bacterium]